MATTVIGVFDADIVRKVTNELVKAGFDDHDIDVIDGDEPSIVSEIVERGFPEEDARGYAEAAKRGKALLATSAPDSSVDRAVQIMERYETALDEEEDEEDGGERAKPARARQEEIVPVVEEELTAEKRKFAQGGVRVTSTVREQPVERTVRLREEHVEAERRPADRTLSEEEAESAFQDRAVEMTETTEELELGKEARVVEEVALTKRVEEHEEKVKDKVRRTEVEVEEIGASPRKRR